MGPDNNLANLVLQLQLTNRWPGPSHPAGVCNTAKEAADANICLRCQLLPGISLKRGWREGTVGRGAERRKKHLHRAEAASLHGDGSWLWLAYWKWISAAFLVQASPDCPAASLLPLA